MEASAAREEAGGGSAVKYTENKTRRARVQIRRRRVSGEPHHILADTDARRERCGTVAKRCYCVIPGAGRHRQPRCLGFHQSAVLARD